MRRPNLALVAIGLLVLSGVTAVAPVAHGSNIGAFVRDVNTAWGTPSSPSGASPGDRDVSLTATFQYLYSTPSSTVEALLNLPQGFALYDGGNQTFAATSGESTNSIFQMTFGGIFLSSSLAPGRYNFTLNLWAYLQTSGGVTILPENLTLGVLVEGRPQLQFSAPAPSLQPGQVDEIPVVVTNSGSGDASQLSLTVSSSGASVLSPLLDVPYLAAGNSTTVSVEVYVPSSASGAALTLSLSAAYVDPYGVQQSASQTLGLYVSSAPSPQLAFEAGNTSLATGLTERVPFTISNLGTAPIYQVRTTATSPAQASILSQLPIIAELGPNASVTESLEIYISNSLANSPLQLTLSSTFVNGQGLSGSYAQTVGFYAESSPAPPNVVVSVSPVSNDVSAGTPSTVSFKVENVGAAPLGSPVVSLSVSSPLVVIQNSSYAIPGGTLKSGESATFEAVVSSSTSASLGYYPASVVVTYVDQSGADQSATFTSGLVLTGTIELVIQSPQVTQGATTLSVSGEILNEGFSNAYYASVTGSIAGARGASQADYVGEIDPNTPVPFSLTIPYTPSSSARTANITVNVAFKDSLGTESAYSSSVQTRLTPASSTAGSASTTTSTSTGFDLLTGLEIGVVAGLAAMAAAGFVYIRRNRSRVPSPAPREKEDKGVI